MRVTKETSTVLGEVLIIGSTAAVALNKINSGELVEPSVEDIWKEFVELSKRYMTPEVFTRIVIKPSAFECDSKQHDSLKDLINYLGAMATLTLPDKHFDIPDADDKFGLANLARKVLTELLDTDKLEKLTAFMKTLR